MKPAAAAFIIGGGECGALVRSIDWDRSALGSPASWPQSLRTILNICVSSRFPIAVYWGPEYLMLYNDALLPMVGANKHPWAMGKPAFEVLPEIRAMIEPLFQQVYATGEATWSEDLMLPLVRHEAAEESYFTFTYSPIRNEAGAIGGVLCAVLETTDKVIEGRRLRLLNALAGVTQAKTLANACAAAAEQLAHATSDVPFALLYLLDHAGRVATLAGVANIEPGTPQSPTSFELGASSVWPFDPTDVNRAPRMIKFDGGPAGARGAVMLPIDRPGGGTPLGFIVAGLSPMLRSAESYTRFHHLIAASISQALSNAAAYEAERARAESLATLDRAKTTFFSNVSHEFRTPLTLMLAPIQDLLGGATADRATIELLHRNAQRLLKLVNTLLEFSRIEAGRVDAVYDPVDLSALTTDLASSFRAAIEAAGIELVVDAPALGEAIYVDRDMWEKIVLNLLSNAFKFTFAGTIGVRLRLDGADAVLEVADTGIGIAEADLPRVFERFHRIEGARSRSHEGSGIGLALVQELARLHAGDARVASVPGRGTRFEVRIPRGTAHLSPDQLRATRSLPSTAVDVNAYVQEASRWGGPLLEPAATASRSGERIVFADDNADMREYVARLLGERWDVETVNDGVAALDAIRRAPPSLVLCDVMMPGLDGFELARELRTDPSLRPIPIIMLSARAGFEEAAKGLDAGANDYIAKPFSARELLVRVASQLATARIASEMAERERAQRANFFRHFMQAPFPIAVLAGCDHRVELANPEILRAWGAGAEVIGRPLVDAVPDLRDQPFIGFLDDVFRTGAHHEGRSVLVRLPTGPRHEIEDAFYNFVYAPLRDTHGVMEGILVAAFNVTEQVHVQAFQERFVAVLGHDLRNPLAAIEMGASLVREHIGASGDAAAVRATDRIGSSARRMSRMVEQILDLTRSRTGGGFKIEPAPMDLRVMLSAVVDELHAAYPDRAIALHSTSIEGVWDRDRLEQVFSNLIGNAIHHGEAGTPITIEAKRSGDMIDIDVHNEGPPIPEGQRETLFSAFRRGDRDSRTPMTAGLGLGLYISRELVLAHGGDLVVVRSTRPEGTTFRVSLPGTQK